MTIDDWVFRLSRSWTCIRHYYQWRNTCSSRYVDCCPVRFRPLLFGLSSRNERMELGDPGFVRYPKCLGKSCSLQSPGMRNEIHQRWILTPTQHAVCSINKQARSRDRGIFGSLFQLAEPSTTPPLFFCFSSPKIARWDPAMQDLSCRPYKVCVVSKWDLG